MKTRAENVTDNCQIHAQRVYAENYAYSNEKPMLEKMPNPTWEELIIFLENETYVELTLFNPQGLPPYLRDSGSWVIVLRFSITYFDVSS